MVPRNSQRFFWDTDPSRLSEKKNAPYIIERLLETGDLESISWLFRKYPRKDIVEILKKTRSLSPRSAHFWALYFHLDPYEVPCTQKSWPQKPRDVLNG